MLSVVRMFKAGGKFERLSSCLRKAAIMAHSTSYKSKSKRGGSQGSRPTMSSTTRSRRSRKSKTCRSTAEWFTVPHVLIKALLLMFCIVLITLILLWESKGLQLSDLTDDTNDINYRNPIYFYVGLAFLTMLYSIGMTSLGCGGFEIPAITQALVTGVYLLLWLVSSAFVSASVDTLNNTKYIRERGISVLFLTIANGMGFVIVVLFIMDILLAFISLQNIYQGLDHKRGTVSFLHKASIFKYPTGRGSYHRSQKSSKISK